MKCYDCPHRLECTTIGNNPNQPFDDCDNYDLCWLSQNPERFFEKHPDEFRKLLLADVLKMRLK